MKTTILIFFISISLAVQNIAAQQNYGSNNKNENIRCEPAFKNDYKEWKKININGIFICIPKELKYKKIQGVDLSSDEYKNDEILVRIYKSRQAPVPGIELTYKTFKDESKYVNGIWTWVWFYETEENEYKFIRGAKYFVENKTDGDAVTIYLKMKNNNLNELANKILSSVSLVR